jgi:hypothetical protein
MKYAGARNAYAVGAYWMAQAEVIESLSEEDLLTVVVDCISMIVSDPNVESKHTRHYGLYRAMCGSVRYVTEKGYTIFEHRLIKDKLVQRLIDIDGSKELIDEYWGSYIMTSDDIISVIAHVAVGIDGLHGARAEMLKTRKASRRIHAAHT